jgi:hypothetical protein
VSARLRIVSPSVRERNARAASDAWNRYYPVGTPVRLLQDNGETVETRTTSNAQVLGGHSAVVWVFGFAGCYALHRVTPAAPVA